MAFYFSHALLTLAVSLPITALITQLALRRYRLRVADCMQQLGGTAGNWPACTNAPDYTLPKLSLAVGQSQRTSSAVNRRSWIYGAAGVGFAATAASIIAVGEGLNLRQFLAMTALYVWPLYPTLIAVRGPDSTVRWGFPLVYLPLLLLIFVDSSVQEILAMTIPVMILPTVTAWLVFRRSIRSIGPVVFAGLFLIVYTIGVILWNLGWGLAGGSDVVLSLTALVVAVLMLRWLMRVLGGFFGRLYRAKVFSESMLMVFGWWLAFTIVLIIIYSVTLQMQALTILLAWCCFVVISYAGFAATAAPADTLSLLLLRTFRKPGAARPLYLKIEDAWRNIGPVNMIAGADLASDTVEPDEVLQFFAGNLESQFIADCEQLAVHVESLDVSPDRDGTYRVNELYCRADAWKLAFQQLVSQSDLILFDLQGFSRANAGVQYELSYVLETIPLDRVVFLSDTIPLHNVTADMLRRLLTGISSTSPNRGATVSDLVFLDGREGPSTLAAGMLSQDISVSPG